MDMGLDHIGLQRKSGQNQPDSEMPLLFRTSCSHRRGVHKPDILNAPASNLQQISRRSEFVPQAKATAE